MQTRLDKTSLLFHSGNQISVCLAFVLVAFAQSVLCKTHFLHFGGGWLPAYLPAPCPPYLSYCGPPPPLDEEHRSFFGNVLSCRYHMSPPLSYWKKQHPPLFIRLHLAGKIVYTDRNNARFLMESWKFSLTCLYIVFLMECLNPQGVKRKGFLLFLDLLTLPPLLFFLLHSTGSWVLYHWDQILACTDWLLKGVLVVFCVNLTQRKVIREEGTSTEKTFPSGGPVGKFMGHFLD